ncbi:M20 family metallopeptidase [Peribacillus butanolivorans]|uniref:M20 family metallopeptidase n=1 Tax=Peribacillus butanolivorans TaxID=421767 RepID=UPI00207CD93C|nr:M20 family metallopeptidase [Peribacillus butanolivorans]MCO0599981.1 M20 family metallopeptidase [Peribacillus butanolivorans]
MNETKKVDETIQEVKQQVIEWRRYLHQNPELSYQEVKTSQFVYDTLQSFGHLELSRPTKTSVMARLVGGRPGKIIALRADLDALPIQEEINLPFASQNPGIMHACGHDGHTAMLLGVAKILTQLQDQLAGEVRFIFQHAEEMFPGGAKEMTGVGVLDGVDLVIGTHLWSPLEKGKVGVAYGPMMAASDTFWITVNGKGGHAGMPHQTIDSIVIAAQVVTNLQQIVSRTTDPLDSVVISVTQIIGGTAPNILPGSVELSGSVRNLDPSIRETIPGKIERIVKGITEAHEASYEFKYVYGYSPVINNHEVTAVIEETVREVFGEEALERLRPTMSAEDFSAFMEKAPGCFFFVGAGNEEKGITYPHHHARFTIDEEALEIGVKTFVHAALKFLA